MMILLGRMQRLFVATAGLPPRFPDASISNFDWMKIDFDQSQVCLFVCLVTWETVS